MASAGGEVFDVVDCADPLDALHAVLEGATGARCVTLMLQIMALTSRNLAVLQCRVYLCLPNPGRRARFFLRIIAHVAGIVVKFSSS